MAIASKSGIGSVLLGSKWRQQRLPIFCFHGVSTDDEHECFPGFFLTETRFRSRLDVFRRLKMNMLALDEALERLADGSLPPRSAVLTIDDGFQAAYYKARPILNEFGIPAVVYLTTHYSKYQRPIFDNMCVYLLWKGRGRELKWDGFLPRTLLDEAGQLSVRNLLDAHAKERGLSSAEKDDLLRSLAEHLEIDYDDIKRRRLFYLMNADEVLSWRNSGAAFELHTHRHRVFRTRAPFQETIKRNADELKKITGHQARHMSYPGGAFLPEHGAWLNEVGIYSGATCVTGFATRQSNPHQLPRVMDTWNVTEAEIEAWLTGVAGLLPTRKYPLEMHSFAD